MLLGRLWLLVAGSMQTDYVSSGRERIYNVFAALNRAYKGWQVRTTDLCGALAYHIELFVDPLVHRRGYQVLQRGHMHARVQPLHCRDKVNTIQATAGVIDPH